MEQIVSLQEALHTANNEAEEAIQLCASEQVMGGEDENRRNRRRIGYGIDCGNHWHSCSSCCIATLTPLTNVSDVL